jgi:hypothetical protein
MEREKELELLRVFERISSGRGKGVRAMVMRLEHEVNIENPRHHSLERVDTLRRLLAGGARVECDPKRPDFYEVESGSDIYYIHISPVTGNILLLAAWPKDGVPGNEVRTTQAA